MENTFSIYSGQEVSEIVLIPNSNRIIKAKNRKYNYNNMRAYSGTIIQLPFAWCQYFGELCVEQWTAID